MIGARFLPGGAASVIPGPVGALNDSVVEVKAVWGAYAANELRERLSSATSLESPFRVFDILVRRTTNGVALSKVVSAAVTRIMRSPQAITIRALATDLGVSQTTVARVFYEQVGLTPKRLARILRFQYVALTEKRTSTGWEQAFKIVFRRERQSIQRFDG